jgi:large subunit ribosomal protein L13
MNKHSTRFLTKEEARQSQKWIKLDASGKTLGRFASEVALILRGKHQTTFTPNEDCGDGVIIINADKIRVTGAKAAQKLYRTFSGYVGGLRETPYNVMMQKHPERIIEQAVTKMMPRNKMGKAQLKRLRIFKGDKHNMQAQQPIEAQI